MHQVSTKSEHFIAPLAARKLQAAMKLKALSLADVSKKAKVPYTIASRLLGGKHHQPAALARIAKAIDAAPMPEEVRA